MYGGSFTLLNTFCTAWFSLPFYAYNLFLLNFDFSLFLDLGDKGGALLPPQLMQTLSLSFFFTFFTFDFRGLEKAVAANKVFLLFLYLNLMSDPYL